MKGAFGILYRSLCNLIDTPSIILIYHRVTKLDSDPQQLAVDPVNFYDQINYLRREYTLIEVEEFVEILSKKKKMPPNCVILTFDDGYADNYYEALPILTNNNAQAIFYISTSLLNTQNEFWWDTLERILLVNDNTPEELQFEIKAGRQFNFNTRTNKERQICYDALHPIVKNCKTDERDFLIKNFIDWSGLTVKGRETHRILNSEELKKLAISKAAVIGAHTESHPKLSLSSFDEQFKEIQTSVLKLEELLNIKIEHFSYPFGSKTDYDHYSIKACQKMRFKMVCANYHGQVHRWHNQYELPRMLVRNWPLPEFKKRMDSFFRF